MRPIYLKFYILFILAAAFLVGCGNQEKNSQVQTSTQLKRITINEAVRTILYIPLYHAAVGGFFADEGLDVKIVTAGTATASFSSMISGEAEFSQADPMYVPISREQGAQTKVVAQVVARIAVWGLTMDDSVSTLDQSTLKGRKISTHPRPMTAYTYTKKIIMDNGLSPDKDVEIIQIKPPNEISPMLQGKSDYAMTLEPSTSIAVSKGAKVVHSFAKQLGDQIFTGLMTKESYIREHPEIVSSVQRAYQRAMNDIFKSPENALVSAKKFLPSLNDEIIMKALNRMIREQVIPSSIIPSEESWNKAIAVRVEVGDLKRETTKNENFTIELAKQAIAKL